MRTLLGAMLVYTGVGHLSFMREAFAAQVPDVLPFSEDFVVVAWALWSTGALRRTRARRACASADLHKEEKPNTLFAWHRRSLRRH